MGKNKEKKKESQLVIRVEKAEKTAFLELCEALDTSAGRELRRFMREFVASNAAAAQAEQPAPKSRKAQKVEAPVATAEPGADVAAPTDADAPIEDAPETEKPVRKARKTAPTEA
ncbi:hypothetical protein C8J30_11463 [Rhodobacter viridis]|uniref:Uncharacterized protein n=1 Tax=Rhodobacter viridis TaxID=1054202 RepID=A0A318U148_9RHOB|nr:hypothetical protein [Rhodobacter viridis]PYF08125.1 hypothetical protein C8J30_11463 [Rhodobacter viridis]